MSNVAPKNVGQMVEELGVLLVPKRMVAAAADAKWLGWLR